jgi:hypothetical protein
MSALGHKQTFALQNVMSALPPIATLIAFFVMSALGQKRTCALHKVMSALPPIATAKADISLAPVERASRRKKRGLSVEYDWADCDSARLSADCREERQKTSR